MINRIILENYMSHARTVIEPAQGLTVLVGPNNCGKSAVVSALQTLCGDNAGDFMVRHGERVCQVTVETDDGHTITWRRKGAAVMYVIDGREIHRSGRGNLPDDLHEHLRLPKVEASGSEERFDVHFALQKSPIFLIDNEGRAAAFFSTSSDAERLLEVQKRHKAKVAEARTTQRDLAAELKRLEQQLELLAPLDGVDGSLKSAEDAFDLLSSQGNEIAARSRLNHSIAEREADVSIYHGRCAALSQLAAPPELGDDERLDRACDALDRAGHQIARHRREDVLLSVLRPPPELANSSALEETIVLLDGLDQGVEAVRRRCEALDRLDEPPTLKDELPLGRVCSRLADLQAQTGRVRQACDALASLKEAPEIAATAPLASFIANLERSEDSTQRSRARAAILVEVKAPPMQADPAPLDELIRRRTAADQEVARLRGGLEALRGELTRVAAEVRQWSQSHPTCPVCGAATDAERILAGSHVHD
jgi:exonuclease SbcC